MDAGILAVDSKKAKKRKKEKNSNEAAVLEDSMIKIGRLLGLCFGEAGAKIIGANITLDNRGDDFNPLIPGAKTYAIFGFCDIRGFNEVNEVLQ